MSVIGFKTGWRRFIHDSARVSAGVERRMDRFINLWRK
jgi:hypothetical protein